MICFVVLMQGGGGLWHKSPDYITEKARMLRAGYDAFGYLSINNMRTVAEWCDLWEIGLPDPVAEEYKREEDALKELRAKGIEL